MKRENTDSRAQEPDRPSAPERRRHGRRRAFILVVVTLISLATLIGGLSLVRPTHPVTPVALPPAGEPADAPAPRPSAGAPTITPSSEPSPSATTDEGASEAAPLPAPETPSSSTPPAAGGSTKLLIPVAGVTADQLTDTYTDARSEGRTHNAIDIIAPRGTPVVAAADGRIVKLFDSERGGITIYQLDPDERTIYYYAHLDRYADGLAEGHFARRGEVIGYVGDTGNSGAGNYHLHFSVWITSDPKRFWDGENINPYPLLK